MHGRLAFAGLCALFLLLPAATALAAPANDAFGEAKRLSLGTPDATVSNAGATTEPGEAFTATGGARSVCDTEAQDSQAGATAWWWVTGTGRPLTVTTAGSTFDTHLGVFPGPLTGEGAVCQDADAGGEAITVASVAGQRYGIQVGGCVMNPLGCGLSAGLIQVLATSPAAANDLRGAAARLPTGTNVAGDNYAATEDRGEQTRCDGRDIGRTVWYRWTPPDAGRVTFTVGGAPNATIAAFPQSGPAYDCDASPGGNAQLTADVLRGDVLVQVGGLGAHSGLTSDSAQSAFTLSASFRSSGRRGDGSRDRVAARAQMAVRLNGRFTKVRRLTARNVPARTRLQVRCSGRGCPFARSRTRTVRRAKREVSLTSATLRRANLRPRTRLEVRVVKAGLIGLVTRWTFRAGRPPLEQTLCLNPGERSPRRCE